MCACTCWIDRWMPAKLVGRLTVKLVDLEWSLLKLKARQGVSNGVRLPSYWGGSEREGVSCQQGQVANQGHDGRGS